MLQITQHFKELGGCNSNLTYPFSEPAKILYKIVNIGMEQRLHYFFLYVARVMWL